MRLTKLVVERRTSQKARNFSVIIKDEYSRYIKDLNKTTLGEKVQSWNSINAITPRARELVKKEQSIIAKMILDIEEVIKVSQEVTKSNAEILRAVERVQ